MQDAEKPREVQEENREFRRGDGDGDTQREDRDGVRIAPIAGSFGPADTHLGSTVPGWIQTGDAAVSAVGVVPAPYRDRGDLDEDDFDLDLGSRVEEALASDGRIESVHIMVSAAGGTVELSGHVATERERQTAEDIISRVAGVQNVENRITVESPHE